MNLKLGQCDGPIKGKQDFICLPIEKKLAHTSEVIKLLAINLCGSRSILGSEIKTSNASERPYGFLIILALWSRLSQSLRRFLVKLKSPAAKTFLHPRTTLTCSQVIAQINLLCYSWENKTEEEQAPVKWFEKKILPNLGFDLQSCSSWLPFITIVLATTCLTQVWPLIVSHCPQGGPEQFKWPCFKYRFMWMYFILYNIDQMDQNISTKYVSEFSAGTL